MKFNPSSNCSDGEMEDCNRNCAPESWAFDDVCDEGGDEHNDYHIDFNCEEFDFDGGACEDTTLGRNKTFAQTNQKGHRTASSQSNEPENCNKIYLNRTRCTEEYALHEDECYWQDDVNVLQGIISDSQNDDGLARSYIPPPEDMDPVLFGLQVWDNGRLIQFIR